MRAPCYESQTTVSFLYALLLQQATVLPQVKAESKKVWKFIIEREIEAPARFQAIQTHRAAMAILRQQVLAQMALRPPDELISLGSMSVITCAGMFCNGIHSFLPCKCGKKRLEDWGSYNFLGFNCQVFCPSDCFKSCPHQALFVEQLYSSGMVDEVERELLSEPIQKNERRLLRKNSLGLSHRLDEVPLTRNYQYSS